MAARQNREDLGSLVERVGRVNDQVRTNLLYVFLLAVWNLLLTGVVVGLVLL